MRHIKGLWSPFANIVLLMAKKPKVGRLKVDIYESNRWIHKSFEMIQQFQSICFSFRGIEWNKCLFYSWMTWWNLHILTVIYILIRWTCFLEIIVKPLHKFIKVVLGYFWPISLRTVKKNDCTTSCILVSQDVQETSMDPNHWPSFKHQTSP